ncbi:MAG: M48 family metalloprotease [Armatimonadetes bacterium]|nr:M48 family metalloprotease [Armatimonadota bacterium]
MFSSLIALAHLTLLSSGPVAPDQSQGQGQGTQQTKQQDTSPPKTKAEIEFQKEVDDDKKIGKEAADYYDRELKPTKDIVAQKRVEEIGAKLALIANANAFDLTWGDRRHPEFEYKFKVVESKDINAFSLPGGYIYVYQGLVDFVQSDDELAGVLAHEISHADQRHVAWMRKEQEKLAPIQIPLILATIFSKDATPAALSQLGMTAVTNGWSVKAETSADYGGAQLMVAAGYDATGMLTFMERLQAKEGAFEGAVDLGIFRTHPPSKVRAEKIEEFMKKNLLPIRRSHVAYDFSVNSKTGDNGQVTLFFGKRKLYTLGDGGADRAAAISKKLNAFFDTVPDMVDVTTGDDGVIYAKNRELLVVSDADAKANNMTVDDLQNSVAKGVRSSIFTLAYHIWEGRN